ncbi:unannotated protein [freshwater metagenome]|uniref:Phenylalanine--tRNA ligase beta subunit n=1 Tax=freshwater metagenome TaxID=449393 RepID=A0A6J7T1X7_9ZZZZ|nr:phenylalanine--tRNA ligase subunit beta [Actinomycetota bacterium]MSW57326.1 phenylalanine--tRNA ligase subunit beta [Actinomycetota bacterium]MSX47686.1 phenylalanine--tRNA ligase subunit beta [Actinomycetota bacterium]MTB15392.1 phenylalanine--tRNA ligase subunit beta [Actinomycetota bacterium]
MRAPLSWLREYAAIPEDVSPQEIADAFVRVGFEVEEIEMQGLEIVGPLVIGRVLSVEEITEFKKPIRWVGLDCGESETRFVVCGATNFAVDDLVVVALPGASLPGGFNIAQRETYGKISNGMICSSKEIGLSQDHEGILVLPVGCAVAGTDAIALLQIADVIFDIAVNPDRGYALSLRGLAREIAASLDVEYQDPVSSIDDTSLVVTDKGVKVTIEDPSAASVVYIRTLEKFNPLAPTPLWMRRRIEKCGMRSISLAVDITNYVMLELGQPLHAFDGDKVHGGLRIRRAGDIATLKTLDGQIRSLDSMDLLVADDNGALALAGTMGGESSEVTEGTQRIALEAARFDPISIAKNSRRHRLSSEASRRLERGVDPSLARFASARAVHLLIELGGASHVDTQIDGSPIFSPVIELDPFFVSALTGANIDSSTVAEKLRIVGCDVEEVEGNLWKVDPPTWRSDLLGPADLVEEVARMIGYDAIPSHLPPHPVSPGLTDSQVRRRVIATTLADLGLVEIQTYPFLSRATITALGYEGDRAKAFRLANPMSEDFPLLRPHLIPGLLEAAQRNVSRGAKNFALFEMGSVFRNTRTLPTIDNPSTASRPAREVIEQIYSGVPEQPIHVGAVLVGAAEAENWRGKGRAYDWSDAVAFAQAILETCNLDWTLDRSDLAPWHPGRCAELSVGGVVVAHAGELHPRVVALYGLPARACALVVNLSSLPEREIVRAGFIATMPVAVQDIALIVDASVPASSVERALTEGAGPLLESIQLFDRYDQMGEGKVSLAFTLTFRAPDRTLTGAEVSAMREAAGLRASQATGAVVRSA